MTNIDVDVDGIWKEWSARFGAAVEIAQGTVSGDLDEARRAYDDFFETRFAAPPQGVSFEAVDAAGVPAEWFTPHETVPGRTLLYLHGGAYIVGGPTGYHGMVGHFADTLRAKALLPDYRLAPEHPFPAAVEDSLTAYQWLLEQGTDPSSIVVAGDSAGGALAVSVLVAARNHGLPMPAASIPISPWANLEHTGDSMTTKHGIDPLNTREGLVNAAAVYLGGAPTSSTTASPVFADLRGLPPTLVQIGEREVMLSDAVRLAGHLAEAAVHTRLDVWPGMPHVWHLLADTLPQARQAIADASAFAEQHLAQA
ncbi:alpha/beta hydrolase [Streptomyces sp. NPDC058293]|uniref:alpha/beta hydrolase n=1 Tax=Streptomyces sp. NPDC058293 TaxID=3346429 RepID=UPI0036EF06AF